jgi:hypothetical protein
LCRDPPKYRAEAGMLLGYLLSEVDVAAGCLLARSATLAASPLAGSASVSVSFDGCVCRPLEERLVLPGETTPLAGNTSAATYAAGYPPQWIPSISSADETHWTTRATTDKPVGTRVYIESRPTAGRGMIAA